MDVIDFPHPLQRSKKSCDEYSGWAASLTLGAPQKVKNLLSVPVPLLCDMQGKGDVPHFLLSYRQSLERSRGQGSCRP